MVTAPLLWVKVPEFVKAVPSTVSVPEVEVKVPAFVKEPVTLIAPDPPLNVAPELLARELAKFHVAEPLAFNVPLFVTAPVTVKAKVLMSNSSDALTVNVYGENAVVAVTVLLLPPIVVTFVELKLPEL